MKRYTVLFGMLMLVLMVICITVTQSSMLIKGTASTYSPASTSNATRILSSESDVEALASTVASQQGQIYYVATDGDDSSPGTEEQPFRTINKGISVLEPGDTTYVKVGTYDEMLQGFSSGTSWDAPITVAAYPGHTVIVRPSPATFVVSFVACQYVIVDGFIFDGTNVQHDTVKLLSDAHYIRIKDCEIKNAPAYGNGILIASSCNYNEFIHLEVHSNGGAGHGHGLYIEGSYNLVEGCDVHDNSNFGVHIYNGYSGRTANHNVVRKNRVYDNASFGILLGSGENNIAYNNIVWGNGSGFKIGDNGVNSEAYNNTVYNNSGTGILIFSESNGAIVRNNIVYQNGNSIQDQGSGTTQDHNLIDVDPKFVDVSAYDFHLRPTSPAIDSGIILNEVADDFAGVSRPRGGGYDIGAYESPFSTRVRDLRVITAVGNAPILTVTLCWTAPAAAITYTLCNSAAVLTAANWDDAQVIIVPFTASAPGSSEWLTTLVDYTGDILYFALKSQNSVGTWSDLSNNAFWPHLDLYLPLVMRDHARVNAFTLHPHKMMADVCFSRQDLQD
jgi:parallel beta-helix repeat protein